MSYYMVDNPNPNTAQGVYPRRGGHKASGTCIVHTSEGNWRNGVNALTALIQTRSDYGAYHEGCDWLDIVSYYPPDWETWGDSETNNWSYHISAACKTSDWGNMPADVEEGYYRNLGKMAAKFVNYMASQGVIVPLRRISGYEARNKVPGFCAHGDSGISRSDPGANFDWNRFFQYTKDALNGTVTGEDEMAVLDEPVNQIGGGQITLRQMLAEYRPHVTKTHDDLKVIKEQTHESMLNDRTQVYALQDVLKGMSPQDIALALDAKQIAKEVMEEISKIIAE